MPVVCTVQPRCEETRFPELCVCIQNLLHTEEPARGAPQNHQLVGTIPDFVLVSEATQHMTFFRLPGLAALLESNAERLESLKSDKGWQATAVFVF